MTLASVKTGKTAQAPRVLIYGPEGVGKSAFACAAPSPIFICAEDGVAQLGPARFPEPQSWGDVLDAVDVLTMESHDHKTLVIDSLDWLEPLCWDYICKRDSKASIEDYGFSKGQKTIAPAEWRILISKIERMTRAKSMGVILVAHQHVKLFKNPEGEDFERYELAMDAKAAGMFKQWAEAVLFAQFETFVDKDSKTKRVRGVSTGARVIHTQRTAAFDAKNRFDLPPTLPLDWTAFAEAVAAHAPADPTTLKARIAKMLESVSDDELRAKVIKALEAAGEDAARLAKVSDNLSARIGIQAQETAQ